MNSRTQFYSRAFMLLRSKPSARTFSYSQKEVGKLARETRKLMQQQRLMTQHREFDFGRPDTYIDQETGEIKVRSKEGERKPILRSA